MSDVVLLLVVVLAWAVVAYWGKRHGWGAGKRHGFGALAAFVLLVVGANVLHPLASPVPAAAPGADVEGAPAAPESPAPPRPATGAADPTGTLGLTLDQYVENFNALAKSLSFDVRAPRPAVSAGPVNDTALVRLSDSSNVVLTLAKGTHEVESVTFVGMPDATTDGAKLLITAGTVAHAVFPESERAGLADALGTLFKGLAVDGPSRSVTTGGKTLDASLSKVTGFTVTVRPAGA